MPRQQTAAKPQAQAQAQAHTIYIYETGTHVHEVNLECNHSTAAQAPVEELAVEALRLRG